MLALREEKDTCWARVKRPRLRGRPRTDQEKMTGAKNRNGLAFERCEKALKRKSYDLVCENDALKGTRRFATGKRGKVVGGCSETKSGSDIALRFNLVSRRSKIGQKSPVGRNGFTNLVEILLKFKRFLFFKNSK